VRAFFCLTLLRRRDSLPVRGRLPGRGPHTVHARGGISCSSSCGSLVTRRAAGVCAARNHWSQERRARRTPVGDGWLGYQFWLVAEHGMKADYVRNIAAEPTRTAEIASWDSGPLAYGKGAGVTRR
jgi:hypothetical protein